MNQKPYESAEHEFEAALGLPEPLPAGETILWQGAPNWIAMAKHVFRLQWLAVYFAVIVVLQMLELQQKNLLAHPTRELLKLNIDAGGVQSRRVIDRLLAQEMGQAQPDTNKEEAHG